MAKLTQIELATRCKELYGQSWEMVPLDLQMTHHANMIAEKSHEVRLREVVQTERLVPAVINDLDEP